MKGTRTYALNEICELVTDGTHDSPKLQSQGVPFIKGKHINTGKIDFDGCDFITEEDHERCIRRVKPQRDDVLLANIGASIGDCARVNLDIEFSIKNVALLRPDPKTIDRSYFFYLVQSGPFQGRLLNQRLGAAQPYVSLEALRALKVPVVEGRALQCKIGSMSDAYDDLIENNRRRIALLEEAARMLYREWFVHFRFPGHEHLKIIDGFPEGWKRRELGDLVDHVKNTVKPADFLEDEIHIGLEHIPRRSFTLSDWEAAEDLASGKTRFEEGDILFCKIRPYFHKVGFAIRAGVASSDALVWRVKKKEDWPLLVCATSSDHFVAVASKTVREGSKMPRADWDVLKKYSVPKPLDGLLGVFNDVILPITAQCKTLALQNRALAQARDLLLPRLMNGEIAV